MGSVYFVTCAPLDCTGRRPRQLPPVLKIGYARNVDRRLAVLQTGNPFELTLMAVLPNVPASAERLYHRALDQHRFRGEWFHLDFPVRTLVEHIANGARPMTATEIAYYSLLMDEHRRNAWAHIAARREKQLTRTI